MLLDNHDSRIRYYELVLERNLNEPIPASSLPEGFRFEFYRPGDEQDWINVEISAREIPDPKRGQEVFRKYYGQHLKELERRMLFVAAPGGEKVATATAWWNTRNPGASDEGMLHWVAVRREWQGCGLSIPLITRVMHLLREKGVQRMLVPTQTTTWVACRVYLDLGCIPLRENLVSSEKGWEIIRRLTGHPALSETKSAWMRDIFQDGDAYATAEKQEHSCGSVIFSVDPECSLRFLLVQSAAGVWGFPKGHMEPGETEEETALREAREEAGVSVRLLQGFRRETLYMKGRADKQVSYFLARADVGTALKIQDQAEIRDAVWCTRAEAEQKLTMQDRIDVFQEAVRYLHQRRFCGRA